MASDDIMQKCNTDSEKPASPPSQSAWHQPTKSTKSVRCEALVFDGEDWSQWKCTTWWRVEISAYQFLSSLQQPQTRPAARYGAGEGKVNSAPGGRASGIAESPGQGLADQALLASTASCHFLNTGFQPHTSLVPPPVGSAYPFSTFHMSSQAQFRGHWMSSRYFRHANCLFNTSININGQHRTINRSLTGISPMKQDLCQTHSIVASPPGPSTLPSTW